MNVRTTHLFQAVHDAVLTSEGAKTFARILAEVGDVSDPFTLAQLMEVKELGFSLAAAVFIDATLIRTILAPAAMQLLGDRNWWLPPWLDRLLPRINLSEDAGAVAGAEPPEG